MRDGKKVVITYGTYDLLHFGHVALLERARALGDYLIVGVTSDAFDRDRGKLNVHQSLADRLQAVMATGLVDEVVVEEYQGQKISDIKKYGVDIFAIGSDWEGKFDYLNNYCQVVYLPRTEGVEEYQGQKISDIKKYGVDIFAIGSDWEGKFDYLNNYCQVVYLPRTEGVSSTELRAERVKPVALGCIGTGYLIDRFVDECSHVAGIDVAAIWPARPETGVPAAESLESMLACVDAVYICASIERHREYIEAALRANCHVLCESPLFLNSRDMEELYGLADERGLVLMEALKTRYFPAFDHLKLMLESGVVGEVKDIDASFSHVFDELDKSDAYQGSFYDMASYICLPAKLMLESGVVGEVKDIDASFSHVFDELDKSDAYQGSFYDMASYICLPAISFLGPDYDDAQFVCSFEGDFCVWTKCNLLYPHASATLKVGRGIKTEGRGIKTEGDMVITGTKGYVYVPAPWWKVDYFELRGEDLRNTKKYYYECVGQGQRYEAFEFVRLIGQKPEERIPLHTREEVAAVTRLVERFDQGDVATLGSTRYAFGGGERIDDR